MTIRAQSADGTLHEFPAGTDMAIVDRAMGDYARDARAGERVAQERKDSPTLMAVDDHVRQFARGAPFVGQYLDEASAGLNTGFGLAGDYGEELAYQRTRDKTFEAEHPTKATALQIGGGVAGGGAALATGVPLLGVGQKLATQMATGGAIGAGMAAVDGFGAGEGSAGERLERAASAAPVGAMGGAAAPALAQGVSKAVTAVMPNRAPPTVGEIATAARTASNPAERVMNDVVLRKAQVVEGALERARASGRPEGEAIKAEFKSILTDKAARSGFSGDELRAMTQVVHGDMRRGLLEMAGRGLAPSQETWLMHMLAGLASGGATTPLAATGYAAKHMAGQLPARDAARLSELIRAGGSDAALAAARAPNPVPGQVLGAGAGLSVLGSPDDRRVR